MRPRSIALPLLVSSAGVLAALAVLPGCEDEPEAASLGDRGTSSSSSGGDPGVVDGGDPAKGDADGPGDGGLLPDGAIDFCDFAGGAAAFCDNFDRGTPLARWAAPMSSNADGGSVAVAAASAASSPNHLRAVLPSVTYAAGAAPASRVQVVVPTAFSPVRLAFAYRLSEYGIPAGATGSRAAVISLQRQDPAGNSAFARLELTAGAPGSKPQMILRIMDASGVTELHVVSLTAPDVSVGEWHRYEMRLEPDATAGGSAFVTLTRDGTTWLPRTKYAMPITSGDGWILRVGGFATASPMRIPSITQDFDDVVLTAE